MKWPSAKEELILCLLAKGEMYGLSLIAASNGGLVRGTTYTVFGRLVKEGFLASRQELRESGIPRRYYRLTPKGERFLRAKAVWDGV